jgi:nitrogen regulatory protein PII-like uncharacterized protein
MVALARSNGLAQSKSSGTVFQDDLGVVLRRFADLASSALLSFSVVNENRSSKSDDIGSRQF